MEEEEEEEHTEHACGSVSMRIRTNMHMCVCGMSSPPKLLTRCIASLFFFCTPFVIVLSNMFIFCNLPSRISIRFNANRKILVVSMGGRSHFISFAVIKRSMHYSKLPLRQSVLLHSKTHTHAHTNKIQTKQTRQHRTTNFSDKHTLFLDRPAKSHCQRDQQTPHSSIERPQLFFLSRPFFYRRILSRILIISFYQSTSFLPTKDNDCKYKI